MKILYCKWNDETSHKPNQIKMCAPQLALKADYKVNLGDTCQVPSSLHLVNIQAADKVKIMYCSVCQPILKSLAYNHTAPCSK